MAVHTPTTGAPSRASSTRRGILGALAFAPAIALPLAPALASTSSAAWDRAMLAYECARAEHDPLWAQYKAAGDNTALKAALDSSVDQTCDALYEAQEALLAMPAPHQQAVLWKLEYFLEIEGDGYTTSWRRDYIQPMIDDARRLLSDGRA